MTDGRDPAYRDWSEGYDPGDLAGPGDPRHPGGGLPAGTASTRCPDRVRTVGTGKIGVAFQLDTRRYRRVSVEISFPTSHIRPYSHQKRGTWVTGGEAGACLPRKTVPAMPTHAPGDISDVKFLTVAEVAAMMRVSKMTVYRLVHSGELPAVRVGRSFRVTEEDVNEYLRKSFYSAG